MQRSSGASMRILLVVLLAGFAIPFLTRPAEPVLAAHTQVFLTRTGRLTPETIVGFFSGTSQLVDVRIKDMDYASGLGAFEFTITFDPRVTSVGVTPCSPPPNPCTTPPPVTLGPFLGSTGRAVSCTPPEIDPGSVTPPVIPGSVNYSCNTIGAGPPEGPPGPQGSGVLARISFLPGASAP